MSILALECEVDTLVSCQNEQVIARVFERLNETIQGILDPDTFEPICYYQFRFKRYLKEENAIRMLVGRKHRWEKHKRRMANRKLLDQMDLSRPCKRCKKCNEWLKSDVDAEGYAG